LFQPKLKLIQKFVIFKFIETIEFNHIVLKDASFLHCAAVHFKEKMAMLLIDMGIDLDLRDVHFEIMMFLYVF